MTEVLAKTKISPEGRAGEKVREVTKIIRNLSVVATNQI